ncbi:MAG: T9SS type A sorting domain-containing protein [Bacteroidetes bacterium]|nr:T9SS type A sorting domain-containing protein [Bacteroidota bacterium]
MTLANGETGVFLVAIMGGDDPADIAAHASDAQTAIPVELLSFDAILDGRNVSLRWATASETNNAGFEVQMDAGSGFQALGFVNGHGTTTEAQTYSFAIRDLDPGTYVFRLKQIDFDGAFEYHGDLEVAVETPDRYVLMPAYPNPFNPEATVRFAIRDSAPVTLTLHDALGRQVSTLYSGTPEANQTLSVRIDGSGLPSGLYLVRLTGSNFSALQPVTLLK